MADNKSGASHELGNLFVDIGSSGLGSLLKGLNSLSATFMLTKNAAQQFTKPIMDMSKNAGKGLVGLQKINAVTGLTIEQLQELKLWANANSVDFGNYINQISNFQQNLLDIAMGRGNVTGFALLGLNPRDMDYKKPVEALEKIKKRVLQLDEATGALALKELGLSADLLYQWKRKEVQIDKNLLLNKKEQQALQDQNDAWNKLSTTIDALFQKIIANQPWISDFLNSITTWLTNSHPLLDVLKQKAEGLFKYLLLAHKGWKDLINASNIIINLNKNNLKDKYKDLTPEQKAKYDKLTNNEGKKKHLITQMGKIVGSMATPIISLPNITKPLGSLLKNKIGYIKGEVDKAAEKNYKEYKDNKAQKAIPTNGKLISQEPIKDIPANISGNGQNEMLSLPSHLQNNQNVMTNNITITQNITGNNATEIAARSRSGISEDFNSVLNTTERELSHGY